MDKIEHIRSLIPDIAITTDVIVGIPGETDEMFLEMYEFIKKIEFSEMHVFPYSMRSGTKAADMLKFLNNMNANIELKNSRNNDEKNAGSP